MKWILPALLLPLAAAAIAAVSINARGHDVGQLFAATANPENVARFHREIVAANATADLSAEASTREDSLPVAQPAAVLLAVGDVMLSRNVAVEMKKHGIAYPFAGVRDILHSGDIVFGNLETSIFPGRAIKTVEMVFRADPGSENELKDAGFTVLSLANNHVPNFGPAAVSSTIRNLAAAGLAEAGAGGDEAQARRPAIVTHGGLTFAFLAYNDTDVVPASYGASANHAGTALMDVQKMKDDVAAVRKRADVVIVSMHAGREYADWPSDRQTKFAKAAVDAGADLVIGHHPHVVQPVELYKGKYIFYSLGNFVFDQMWSEPTRRGLALKIAFNRGGLTKLTLLPVYMKEFAQPQIADDAEAAQVFKSLVMPVEKTAAGEYVLKP